MSIEVEKKIESIARKIGCSDAQVEDLKLLAGEFSLSPEGKLQHGADRGKFYMKTALRERKPHLFPTNLAAPVQQQERKTAKAGSNPWSGENPDLKKIAAFIASKGTKAAASLALAAGKSVNGKKLIDRTA
jgi:hypothetical protein